MVNDRPPEWWPPWLVDFNLRFDIFVKKLRASQVTPWNIDEQEPEQKEKLELLYNEMMKDINASDISENIKVGLDPVPAMVGFLLAAAGGGAVSMVLGSLLMPYVQSKLTYPMQRQAQPYRLPPDIVFRLAWKLHKGESIPEELLGDLRDQGFDQGRIEKGLEASKVVPTPSDIIAFLAHEVFEPDMVKKYGLDEEFEAIDQEPALKIGLDEATLKLYWRNHWQHTSFTQMIQLRRREIITDEDVWEWFRLVEIPPYWRDKLIELIWTVPTRIDTRRFWDMGTIDEPRLRQLYTAFGYQGQNLEDYVLWTKVYVAFPDLIARYKNGWIDEETVRSELAELGMPAERVETMWQTKFKKAASPERVESTRQLTRALIIKGAKKLDLEEEETIQRLRDIGYGLKEAQFIYKVEVLESASPETPLEYKAITDSYRRAIGVGVHETTEAALQAEKAWVEAKLRLKEAREKGEPQAELLTLEALVTETKARFEAALAQSEE